jgi:hypothetical protein
MGTNRHRPATRRRQDAPVTSHQSEDAMQAVEERPGLWAMMRQRWLDLAAQPQDAHLREDIGLPSLAAEARYVPPLVQAWRR